MNSFVGFLKKASAQTAESFKSTAESLKQTAEVVKRAAENASSKLAQSKTHAEVAEPPAGFLYVTDRVLAMAYPSPNRIEKYSKFLLEAHGGKFMVWNLSEKKYNTALFDGQVIEFNFPGYPAPPLDMLFKICNSIKSWLNADPDNVAVIHCQSGKGRTAVVISCFLAWAGIKFAHPVDALNHFCTLKHASEESILYPSHKRYLQYFASVLDGTQPSTKPVVLRRVIFNGIPQMETDGGSSCRPYLQLFKAGQLIYSSTRKEKLIRSYFASDISFSFSVETILEGDILLRCRHLARDSTRVSMFRVAFHTGFVGAGIIRLSKAQLDGAHEDPKFSSDFFIDLIFTEFDEVRDADLKLAADSAEPMKDDEEEEHEEGEPAFWSSVARASERRTKAMESAPATDPHTQTQTQSQSQSFSISSYEDAAHYDASDAEHKPHKEVQPAETSVSKTIESPTHLHTEGAAEQSDFLAQLNDLEKELDIDEARVPKKAATPLPPSTSVVDTSAATASAPAAASVPVSENVSVSVSASTPAKVASSVSQSKMAALDDDDDDLESYFTNLQKEIQEEEKTPTKGTRAADSSTTATPAAADSNKTGVDLMDDFDDL